MQIKSKINIWRAMLKKPYKVVIIDEATMMQRKSLVVTRFRVLACLALLVFIVSLISILLATQTRLITFLGPLPKALVGRDYKELSNRLDSMELLSDAREKKLLAIEKLLTKGIQDSEPLPDNVNKMASSAAISTEEHLHSNDHVAVESFLPIIRFAAPVAGEITSGFDPEQFHMGIDLAAKAQSEISAAAEGLVIFSRYTKENGYTIWILHPSGYRTSYKHNSLLRVMIGQYVMRGESIAVIGNTGESSTGPHLHFELWRDRIALDPQNFIKF